MKTAAFASALILAAVLAPVSSPAADAPKPLRALLLTGGCCHDYAKQKDILKLGLEARANIVVDQVHTDDKSTKPPLAHFGNPDYAKGYDIVIHDECAADLSDPAKIQAVLAPHKAGIPGVNLHCSMHSYRIGNPGQATEPGSERAGWFDYLGIQSSGHGPQQPIAIKHVDKSHPVTKGMEDWMTINEELYNNIKIRDTATPLARGTQLLKQKEGPDKATEYVVTWVNQYQGKTRVFSTTIGHNNATVADAKYLDLITRGVLWATDKLDAEDKPKAGYGSKQAAK